LAILYAIDESHRAEATANGPNHWSDTARIFPREYLKDGMHAWQAIESREMVYVPRYVGTTDEPYKSILCLPLSYQTGSQTKTMLGVLTIDHAFEHEFDEVVENLKIVLSPYLRLLELALVYRLEEIAKPKAVPVRRQRGKR
jgi:hypothetical protein